MAERIYPFAVARIRVMENRLLTKQQMLQMADAKTAEDVLRVLKEAGYETDLAETVYDYEAVLAKELEKTNALMQELVPEERFMELFLYKNDYHNLKVLIKADLSGTDGTPYLMGGGTISLDTLQKAVETREFKLLPELMAQAAAEAYEAYAATRSGQMIDVLLDRATLKSMEKTAEESKLSYVTDYVKVFCDITNLKTFYRIKRMGKSVEELKKLFLEGGSMGLSLFVSAFGMEQYWHGFQGSSFGEICQAGMPKGFTEFERLCDNYMMGFVRSAKYMALTVEPLVAYLYAKESELKTVRIIMTGKLNGMNSETIKERLRDAYV